MPEPSDFKHLADTIMSASSSRPACAVCGEQLGTVGTWIIDDLAFCRKHSREALDAAYAAVKAIL